MKSTKTVELRDIGCFGYGPQFYCSPITFSSSMIDFTEKLIVNNAYAHQQPVLGRCHDCSRLQHQSTEQTEKDPGEIFQYL
jgi:hypothetical protein